MSGLSTCKNVFFILIFDFNPSPFGHFPYKGKNNLVLEFAQAEICFW